jgi:hypothetical protein
MSSFHESDSTFLPWISGRRRTSWHVLRADLVFPPKLEKPVDPMQSIVSGRADEWLK